MQKLIMNISGVKLNLFIILFSLFSCQNLIKNEDAKVNDEVSSENRYIDSTHVNLPIESNPEISNPIVKTKEDLVGNWVGWFEKKHPNSETEVTENKSIVLDEYYWGRENKINISIDKIEGEAIVGHTVVAGNNRPFKGVVKENANGFDMNVSEPGNDKYDGEFNFSIYKNNSTLSGKWKSFNKIDIPEREYVLVKKSFTYHPSQMINESSYRQFCDWEKKTKTEKFDVEGDQYTQESYVSATDKIFQINASLKLLTTKEVENLKKGDLLIIRNMIYARHGYSFKNRPLRVFFDAQDWYIPVHTDIKAQLTDIEKQNIALLMKYEKNAKQYYDTFGRGL